MILLALDVGRKKTGIAIGNTHTGRARPLLVARGGRTRQMAQIGEQIRAWTPQKLIVGLPRNMNGEEHGMTRFCRNFAKTAELQFNLPVEFADERQSTAAARTLVQNGACGKSETDAAAAGVILQDWLRAHPA